MNRLLPFIALALLVMMAQAPAAAQSQPSAARPSQQPPRTEVAFVLDTTGSMSGLIEGARQTIWQIANGIVAREPTPQVRFGLIGYRDRGDAYVTQIHDLTADLDAIYGHLTALKAGGGGDGPESVNQALHEAVHDLSWSDDPSVLKIIFLVGDAPPHMDYEQDVAYTVTCEQAVRGNLIINTIQCGTNGAASNVWREIAHLSEGSYAAIRQSGGVRVVATPMDAKLAELGAQLRETVTPYGDTRFRAAVADKLVVAGAAAAPATADRMAYMENSEGGQVVTGGGDLTQEVASGRINVGEVASLDPAALSPKLREMTPQQRQAYLQKQVERRRGLQAEIATLTKQRETYLREQRAAADADDEPAGFDRQVAQMLDEQIERHREAQADAVP